MSDPVIRRVRRSIDEAKNRGGMQVGMPKVTIDAGDAERLCIVAEALATTKAENEAMRVRVAELEMCVDDGSDSWLLRKQAEAVEAAVEQSREHLNECAWPLGGIPDDAEHALQEVEEHAERLRQQADEAERAGGEK